MTTKDGHVVGTTKIVNHGPNKDRWNLVIIGDGYKVKELTKYHKDIQNFLTTFSTTPPFDKLYCGINVHRIDVVSKESGADDPGCAGGKPIKTKTYFDATFCTLFNGKPMDRLLTINQKTALSVATAKVPQRHQVLCLVNSSKYGGAGGTVAVASTHPDSAEIAIHEIGHSAFGLADEYGGNNAAPSVEPKQPNVTINTNRATNKWRALIKSTTPMPSQCGSSCKKSTCVSPKTPPAAGAVGTYEGAIYSNCNTYRPLPSCYMRDYGPFCPVCTKVIRQTLKKFLPVKTKTKPKPKLLPISRLRSKSQGGEGALRQNDSRHNLVKDLQKILIYLKYDLGTYGPKKDGVDGFFGTTTRKAVIKFQRKNKDNKGKRLAIDGLVGPLTGGSLNQSVKESK